MLGTAIQGLLAAPSSSANVSATPMAGNSFESHANSSRMPIWPIHSILSKSTMLPLLFTERMILKPYNVCLYRHSRDTIMCTVRTQYRLLAHINRSLISIYTLPGLFLCYFFYSSPHTITPFQLHYNTSHSLQHED